MAELYLVAVLGGFITGISPCIVPVLPAVLAGGANGERARPVRIIVGLVLSFSLAELLGTEVLSVLGLPEDLLFWLGIALLLAIGFGLLFPFVENLIERPFRSLRVRPPSRRHRGFVFGLGLGLVFVPCAGPVLAAISTAAANHKVDPDTIVVTLLYASGAALPLLLCGLFAQRATRSYTRVSSRIPTVRRVCGVVVLATTLAIALGAFDPLQRDVPSYTSALENSLESGASISARLGALSGEHVDRFAKSPPIRASTMAVTLPDLGKAPDFTGISAWLNTKGDRPLTLKELRGKVVLVDFWTYSCINCQRELPHVEAWYRDYKNYGFVVVGVHTPEFSFEHVISNVKAEARKLGVDYPIAIDNNYATWDAYGNEFWPAEYLIDRSGEVRDYAYGEGDYRKTETEIRELLDASGKVHLPPRTDVANKTPTQSITQESYLGANEIAYDVGTPPVPGRAIDYNAPSTVALNRFAFNGVWTDNAEEATAGRRASIELHFSASEVYLVMGGHGTLSVKYDNGPPKVLHIEGVPRLYQLFAASALRSGELRLSFKGPIKAYDFTFG